MLGQRLRRAPKGERMRLSFSRPKIEDLERYLAEKDYDKALAAVASELRRNPRQFNLLLRQAEILGMAGNRQQAISVYRELAEKYARDGFYAKAIALYKKVLRLAPELEEIHGELARLIEEDQRARRPLEERLAIRPTAAPAAPPDPQAEPRPEPPPETPEEMKELRASALFASFREQALEEILTSTSLRSYQEGDIIVTEGEIGSSLFLIVSGEVKVFTRGERGEHLPLAELGAGDFFGEVSLLTGKPRTATITAKNAVIAIELSKDDVDRISAEHPEVRSVLEDFYQRRAHETVEAVIRRLRGE
jgi:cAMP-dependent protein kinase regulator